jgi:hypothetical protein
MRYCAPYLLLTRSGQRKMSAFFGHYGIENVRVDGDAVGIFGPMGHTFYLDDAEIQHRAIDYDELQDELIYEK